MSAESDAALAAARAAVDVDAGNGQEGPARAAGATKMDGTGQEPIGGDRANGVAGLNGASVGNVKGQGGSSSITVRPEVAAFALAMEEQRPQRSGRWHVELRAALATANARVAALEGDPRMGLRWGVEVRGNKVASAFADRMWAVAEADTFKNQPVRVIDLSAPAPARPESGAAPSEPARCSCCNTEWVPATPSPSCAIHGHAPSQPAPASDGALRRAAEDILESLGPIEKSYARARCISVIEDRAVRDLCERHGYGAVMDSAARLWSLKDPVGCKTVGPCFGVIEKEIAALRAALSASAPSEGKGSGTKPGGSAPETIRCEGPRVDDVTVPDVATVRFEDMGGYFWGRLSRVGRPDLILGFRSRAGEVVLTIEEDTIEEDARRWGFEYDPGFSDPPAPQGSDLAEDDPSEATQERSVSRVESVVTRTRWIADAALRLACADISWSPSSGDGKDNDYGPRITQEGGDDPAIAKAYAESAREILEAAERAAGEREGGK